MTTNDRLGPAFGVSSNAASTPRAGGETQSATFEVGALTLELSAAPGAARLVVSGNGVRDTYVVEPSALAQWAAGTQKLLALQPAGDRASDRAEFRAPFLIDREGRASITFEGLVSADGIAYRLLVTGAHEKLAGLMTTPDVVRGVAEAAAGAVAVAKGAQ